MSKEEILPTYWNNAKKNSSIISCILSIRTLVCILYTPPPNEVWERGYRNYLLCLFVRPSVCAKFVSEKLEVSTSNKDCFCFEGVSLPWPYSNRKRRKKNLFENELLFACWNNVNRNNSFLSYAFYLHVICYVYYLTPANEVWGEGVYIP